MVQICVTDIENVILRTGSTRIKFMRKVAENRTAPKRILH